MLTTIYAIEIDARSAINLLPLFVLYDLGAELLVD